MAIGIGVLPLSVSWVGTCFILLPSHPPSLPLTHRSQIADSLFAFHYSHLYVFLFVVAEYFFLSLNYVFWQDLVCLFIFYKNFSLGRNLPMMEHYGGADSCGHVHCSQHGFQSMIFLQASVTGVVFSSLRCTMESNVMHRTE